MKQFILPILLAFVLYNAGWFYLLHTHSRMGILYHLTRGYLVMQKNSATDQALFFIYKPVIRLFGQEVVEE